MRKAMLFLIPLVVLVSMVLIWKNATYKELTQSYPLEHSKNPEASKAFIHALEYRIYIKELHPYLDYDSIVMKPLFWLMDHHFHNAQKLLPSNSVEDVFWWVIFYKDIYGIGVIRDRNDNSLAYDRLTVSEFKEKHREVSNMIRRYAEGSVYFDTKHVRDFEFPVMDHMIRFFYGRYPSAYEDTDDRFKDQEVLINLKEIMALYQEFSESYLIEMSQETRLQYYGDIVAMSSDIIAFHLKRYHTKYVTDEICHSIEAQQIKKLAPHLMNYVKQNDSKVSQELFQDLFLAKGISTSPVIFALVKSCDENTSFALSEVLRDIYQLN